MTPSPTHTTAPRVQPQDPAELAHRIAGAFGILMVTLVVASFVATNTRLQWDLHAYRYAARAALVGLDPYRVENLAQVAVRPWELPFVYPPIGLVPFLPLAALTPTAAGALWMAIKLGLLMGLVALWRRAFFPAIELFVLVLVAVFAFDATTLHDLRAGNVAIVEAALLWSGFACWVAGRRRTFAALVVAASLFKLVPIIFLGLLLVPTCGERRRPALLAVSLGAFVALVALPRVVGPAAAWSDFTTSLMGGRPQGATNPSAQAMLDAVARAAFPTLRSVDAGLVAWCLYVAGVAALGARWLRGLWRARDPREWVMAASLLYVLVHPRPMSYGYVMAIAPTLWFAPAPFTSPTGRLALALVLSAQGLARLADQQPPGLLLEHLSFLTVLVVWLAVLRQAEMQGGPKAREAPSPA